MWGEEYFVKIKHNLFIFFERSEFESPNDMDYFNKNCRMLPDTV